MSCSECKNTFAGADQQDIDDVLNVPQARNVFIEGLRRKGYTVIAPIQNLPLPLLDLEIVQSSFNLENDYMYI